MEDYNKEDFNKCCYEDESRLAYPRFSAVFLQTFCIHDSLQFVVPEDAVLSPEEYKKNMKEIREDAQKHAKDEAEKKRKSESAAENNPDATENKTGAGDKPKDDLTEGWMFKSFAEHVDKPIAYMYQDIEKQIFINPRLSGKSLSDEMENEKKILEMKYLRSVCGVEKKKVANRPFCKRAAVYTFPNSSVYRFSMAGFNFSVPVEFENTETNPEDRIDPILLKGHANVEMSLFYGNTVSIAYKFFFDGYTALIRDADDNKDTKAVTDHIIAFLSCHLGAEFWSENKKLDSVMTVKDGMGSADRCDINFFQKFNITGMWIDEDGDILSPPGSLSCGSTGKQSDNTEEQSEKRPFNDVMLRYKRFLYKNCTAYKKRLKRRDILEHESFRENNPLSVSLDHHYAMVDIWGDVKHVLKGLERDVFAETDEFKLSEPAIIDHIRDYHKPELIGLMTLYPKEWKYRDGKTFDYVCGDSVAIDTDDLVLVGTHMAVVVGTYDRRGAESVGNDWKAMAKVKAKYQVAWPEYLMILQFVLAKKAVIGSMKDRMIRLIEEGKQKSHKGETL